MFTTTLPRHTLQWLWLLPILVSQTSSLSWADEPAGKTWAILIGCEKYHRATPLRFTNNDIRQLSTTLRQRAGVADNPEASTLLEMTDQATNPRHQPLRANLMAEVPALLKNCRPEDSVLMFFSGHGFRDAVGKLYLAPLDVDPDRPADTAVSLQWLRDTLANCAAGCKLLIVDACHAGSDKGDDEPRNVSSKDLDAELKQQFSNLDNVVTLASSMADQKSQIWDDKEQSLYSYWLNQGLKGHADADGDAAIDVDELHKYVSRMVTQSAKLHFPREQQPVRNVRSSTIDVPIVVRLRPQNLKQVLNDMAEQLTDAMYDQRQSQVGVLEFINTTPGGESLCGEFGLLGRYCSEEIERHLLAASAGKFSVVDRRRLDAALKQQRFSLDDLGSSAAMKQLGEKVGGMPVVVEGMLRGRTGSIVNLQCKLVSTNGEATLASVGGTALITESQWAMLGRSVMVKPDDRRPPWQATTPQVATSEVIGRLDQRATGPHPMAQAQLPFRVKIMVREANGKVKERPGMLRGNDWLVPLRKGEVYEIYIELLGQHPVMAKVLVDGLNTLPQKETVKGVSTTHGGQRVSLDEARPWVLDPDKQRVYAIRGFVTETGVNGNLKEFLVVDAEQSLAARKQFTDQIGLITAAFYTPATGARAVGTTAGEERNADLTERTGFRTGNLLGVIHIRYVDPSAIGQ